MPEQTAPLSRRDQIIDAATSVFLRYGYARTTMSDIAKAAGLTRPTLYLSFPDKERIFAAVVDKMIVDKLADIRARLPQYETFEEKLRFACEAWAAEGYELMQAHPDAADLFDQDFQSVCTGYGAFEALLAELIRAPLQSTMPDLPPEEAAHAIVAALDGFEESADSAAEMRGLIAIHARLVAKAIGG